MKFGNIFAFAATALVSATSSAEGAALFSRISTFSICEQIDADCSTDEATNAETIWYYTTSSGGTSLVYTDSESENVGFVDISDPTMPTADGVVPLSGEPTTVRVIDNTYGTYLTTLCHDELKVGMHLRLTLLLLLSIFLIKIFTSLHLIRFSRCRGKHLP